MKHLSGSKYGEGIGRPVEITDDPNSPSFDPAEKQTATDKKIREMMDQANAPKLAQSELVFLSNVYGADRLSRSQHIYVSKLHRRVCGGHA